MVQNMKLEVYSFIANQFNLLNCQRLHFKNMEKSLQTKCCILIPKLDVHYLLHLHNTPSANIRLCKTVN